MKHYYRAVLAIFAALLLFVMTSFCTGIMLNQLLIDYDQGRSEIMDIYKDALPGSAGYEAYKEAKQNHQFLEELEENENFEGFLMFCKSLSIEPGYDIMLNYYNKDNNTDIKTKLSFGNVKEFCLVIDSQSEIVRLTYKDGKFNEDYQVIRRITEKELSDENKTTVGSVKKLIK